MSVDEWYNAVQAQINLAKYPAGNSKDLTQRHILIFSQSMKNLSLKPLMILTLTWRYLQPVK